MLHKNIIVFKINLLRVYRETTKAAESPKRKGKGKGKSSSTEVPSTFESRKREASEEPSVVYIPSKKAK